MKRWKWLFAGILSLSLLGACATDEEPQDGENTEEQDQMDDNMDGEDQDTEMDE
ncbi:hypothetical protein [Salimicrobium halophilum]|uniref:Uncharacterized protein n=1 Tax=Salimicrobium halophilum TaxID=86666 RepID=A0A1G8SGR9_9BACI|nr:hypothetical protein [Salimicrobium halophilum]SDJ27955.1 hypothetical protein SAMN04490247_1432 [Salimicrobium halophilum]